MFVVVPYARDTFAPIPTEKHTLFLPRSKQTIITWSSNEEKERKEIHPSEDNLLISLEVIRAESTRGCVRDKGARVRLSFALDILIEDLTRMFLLRPVFRDPDKCHR